MVIVKTDSQHYTNIATKIREKTGGDETYTPSEMAEGVEKVFDAGKKAEYDAFWDTFQRNGTRSTYASAFANSYWSGDAYKPKYPITPTSSNGASQMFAWNASIEDIIVPVTIYDEVNYLFCYCSSLKRIPKLIITPRGLTKAREAFDNCTVLEELNIEGTINIGGLNFQWSTKLSKTSIESVINALSTTTSGLTITFSATAVSNAFESGSTGSEWLNLIATKSNWTIALA